MQRTRILSSVFLGLLTTLTATSRAGATCTCPSTVDVECRPVAASSLSYSDKADDTKDKLSYTVKGAQGPSTFPGLGNPSTSDSACLCMYNNGSLIQLAQVPASGTCGGAPCWTLKPDKAWRFKDTTGAHDGVTRLALTFKAAGPSSGAALTAKGVEVADLSLPLSGPVAVQLRTGYEQCVGAEMQIVSQDAVKGKLKLKQKLNGPYPACDDSTQNGFETGVDCGGPCAPCVSCSNGIQDGDETALDCGGSCPACAWCSNGIEDGDETGIDCGGSCSPCTSCRDGIQNGAETGVDCGGGACPLCPTGVSKRIFVGLHYTAPMLSNIAQIDTHCTELAQGLDPTAGTFYAWLCTNESNDPDSRFTKYSDPYVRFDGGLVIASGGWNQLTGGDPLDNPIESTFAAAGPHVWTGTTTAGECGASLASPPENCEAWTTDSSGTQAMYGISTLAGGGSWNAHSTTTCDSYYAVYCVEQ